MATEPLALDRRQRRRLETIEEVLDVAVDVMREQGVAGLSVGEVARRMGIRTPSLYVYFESKNALYDALFARGARSILDAVRGSGCLAVPEGVSLEAALLRAGEVFVRWAVDNSAYTQLLFWRPVPGFAPSQEAYAAAIELTADSIASFAELQRRGLIRNGVAVEDVYRDWTIVISGIVSQQLSNAPDEPYETGSFTSRLPTVAAMFAGHYAPPRPTTPARRNRRADQR